MVVGVVGRVNVFFFFNDTATTEIYTLSLHDALPISGVSIGVGGQLIPEIFSRAPDFQGAKTDIYINT